MKSQCVLLCIVFLTLAGCEGMKSMNKETMGSIGGGVLGAAGGAAVGAAIFKDNTTGMLIGSAVGALAGALVGNRIGAMLDERDKKKHEEAVAKALETGQPQSWNSSDTGASGQVAVKEPVATPVVAAPTTKPVTQPAVVKETESAPPTPQVASTGRLCRTVTQTIKLKDGTTKTEDLTACKGPNGWEAA